MTLQWFAKGVDLDQETSTSVCFREVYISSHRNRVSELHCLRSPIFLISLPAAENEPRLASRPEILCAEGQDDNN